MNSATKITKTAKIRKHTKKSLNMPKGANENCNFTKITRITIIAKIRKDLRGTQRELRKLQKSTRRMPWKVSEGLNEKCEFYENYENYENCENLQTA